MTVLLHKFACLYGIQEQLGYLRLERSSRILLIHMLAGGHHALVYISETLCHTTTSGYRYTHRSTVVEIEEQAPSTAKTRSEVG